MMPSRQRGQAARAQPADRRCRRRMPSTAIAAFSLPSSPSRSCARNTARAWSQRPRASARDAQRQHRHRQRAIVDGQRDAGEREQDRRSTRPEPQAQSRSQHGPAGLRAAREGARRPDREAQIRRERQHDREARREREAPEAGLAQRPPRDDHQRRTAPPFSTANAVPFAAMFATTRRGCGDGGRRHGRRLRARAPGVVDPGGEAPLELVAIEAAGQRAQRARARTTAAPARPAPPPATPASPRRTRRRPRRRGCVSAAPPSANATTGRPAASASTGTMPKSSIAGWMTRVARARTGDRPRRRRRARAARRWRAPGAPGDRGRARRRRRPGGRAAPPSRAPPARRACTGPAPTRTGRSARRRARPPDRGCARSAACRPAARSPSRRGRSSAGCAPACTCCSRPARRRGSVTARSQRRRYRATSANAARPTAPPGTCVA